MLKIAGLLYAFLYTLALGLYLPFYVWRTLLGGRKGLQLSRRLWRLPPSLRQPAPGPKVWVHAVSVGEVNAVEPLVRALAERGVQVFLSTTTDTGQEQARRLFREQASTFYFPVDWQWLYKRILKHLHPRAIVVAETELWPGLLLAARSRGVAVALVNGRLSDASFRRYRRLRFFFAPLLRTFKALCVQTLQDKKRLLEMGAAPEQVHWTGNLKYDFSLSPDPQREELARRVASLLRAEGRPLQDPAAAESRIWVCGSTREGEEELLMDCLLRVRRDFEALRMVLAPRHPHRCDAVESLARKRDLSVLRRSRLEEADQGPAPDILLVDTIGDLRYLYQCADVVFVGGSLVRGGGQNILEPAYFGKAVLFGPHMENFREMARSFTEAYAALQVSGPEELSQSLLHLLQDPTAAEWLGRNARKVMRSSQGALERTLEILAPCLGEPEGGKDR